MKNRFSGSLARISVILLMVMLAMSAARLSYSAPSEENISGSRSLKTSPLQPSPSDAQGQWSEPSGDNPANQESDQDRSGDEGAQVPGSVSSEGPVVRPRAVFPYTIRPGDTPAGIAALFGVRLADLMRVNHLRQDSQLMIGDTLRVPNPFLARQRELSAEVDRLTAEKQAAEQRADTIQGGISGLRSHVQDLDASNKQYRHDLHTLPWWRAAAVLATGAAALMLSIMLVAVIQWLIMRSRFRAVAEMNESLRRLDYKYKAAFAKAELRFQELYGRRRRGIQDGEERSKTPEESEIEQLNRQLKDVLERHLQRLEPSSSSAGRARWRERLAGIGAPMEARSIRR
jgi:LysM repeat protein